MIDVLYVSSNRLEFTRQSFEALLANTDWDQVKSLYVADDGSTDGTAEYLFEAATTRVPSHVRGIFNSGRFGGPVAAMNWYLDEAPHGICLRCVGTGRILVTEVGEIPAGEYVCEECDGSGLTSVDVFAKIDNDFVVCPGWLPEMLRQLELHPSVDILGTEPFLGDPAMPGTVHRDVEIARHIGGKGLIRLRSFSHCRPQPGGYNGYQGFTQWQEKHDTIVKAWISPDLPCFGLDQIRPEHGPWRALAEEYEAKGWQRLWPVYGNDEHYAWWEPV